MRNMLWTAALLCVALTGCHRTAETSPWADTAKWYDDGVDVDTTRIDVFYVCATEVVSETDEAGNTQYNARITDEERTYIDAEEAYMRGMLADSANFFAPYYRQFTFEAMTLPDSAAAACRQVALQDVMDAFDYYMEHLNHGRRFVLAGFSQGAMHVLDLVKHLTDEQYGRMVAAYIIGYRVTEQDMQHRHVRPAQLATDRGVVVTYNSVATVDAVWPMLTDGAAACINPLNWRTDDTPAQLVYDGDTLTVHVDSQYQVLVVDGIDTERYVFEPLKDFCKPGNLHHWDILFYHDALRNNVRERCRR